MSDYVQMWKDLGMDLESHDMLCQVLPTAVGDVFLTQKNRPKAMDFWDLVISEVHGIRPAELIAAQKEGRKVFGTFCVYVPDEVVIAANGIVTGLCGGSQFWVPGGETVLPKSTCPLVKASVGARLGRTCPFFRIADMYVGETTCDAKKKAYEILGEDVPMYVMDVPQMKREKDIIKWKDEIAEFAKKVEEFTAVGVGGLALSGQERAVVVSMGTGTAFIWAEKGREVRHLCGSGVGGGTLAGLCSRLCGTRQYDQIVKLAETGSVGNIDLSVGDITRNSHPSLPLDITAANFGNVSDTATAGDFAAGVVNMVLQSIGTTAVMACRACGCETVVLTGFMSNLPQAEDCFALFTRLHGVHFIIPESAAFATSIGAALCSFRGEA